MINNCDNLLPGLKRRFLGVALETIVLRAVVGTDLRAALVARGFGGGLFVVSALVAIFLRADGLWLQGVELAIVEHKLCSSIVRSRCKLNS